MAMTPLGRRTRLLTGCAMAAAIGGHAHAQSYPDRALQGDHTVMSGDVSINRSPSFDIITVNSAQAIINWNPETGQNALPPGTIDFLPSSTAASFLGSVAGQDFTVLNRIMPSNTTRAISLNGTVTTAISDGQGNYNPGGSVWFYSPGGIIAGPTAVFNVGNLVLTSNDIDASEGLFDATGAIRFRGTAGSTSKIDIQNGARINSGSYLALVAPVVQMGGTVNTGGSVAYVAGESVDVRINSGLFDINFQTGGGTSVTGTVLSHTGSTSSPNGDYTNNGIFLAAMPKNQAISMLLGGTIGYQPAASASVDNGVVVLSAGANIASGGTLTDYNAPTSASILVGAGNITSAFRAAATDTITIKPAAGNSTNFSGSVALQGPNLLVDADGASIGIGGYLYLNAFRTPTGGTATLSARNSGTIDAASYITLDAVGFSNVAGLIGENTVGGTAAITIDNGRVSAAGDVTVNAIGQGGSGANEGGAGTGGLVTVDIKNTDSDNGLRADNVYLNAGGVGGENGYGSVTGGAGIGGMVTLAVDAGAIAASGLFIDATGIASSGGGGGDGGAANGGTIQATFKNLTLDLQSFTANAIASGGRVDGEVQGAGGNGGIATGGNIAILLDNATVTVGNAFNGDVSGSGGDAGNGNGGAATGGIVSFNLGNASNFHADVSLYAEATGGRSNLDYDADDDGVADVFGFGGTATGGSITLGVSESNLNPPTFVDMSSNAVGGIGPMGGSGTGGSILINFPSGTIDPTPSSYFEASANGTGGSTGLRDYNPRLDTARSGDSVGGSVTLTMGGATPTLLQFSTVRLSATGKADGESRGDVGAQGDARGGTITANLTNATINAVNGFTIDAQAQGGDGASNYGGVSTNSGNAFGGNATLNASNSTVSSNSIETLAGALGGNGVDYQLGNYGYGRLAAFGGSATGGSAQVTSSGGTLGGTIRVDAAAVGGSGGSGEQADGVAGGSATGGTAFASFDFTQVGASLLVYSTATGGAGGSETACDSFCIETGPFGAGNGGNATAGAATLNLFANNSTVDTIDVSAAATGGAGGSVALKDTGSDVTRHGGNGGVAIGAEAMLGITGLDSSFGTISLSSYAFGGSGGGGATGGIGANGTAGSATLQVGFSTLAPSLLSIDTRATGGAGGASSLTTGGAGGTAQAGAIEVRTVGSVDSVLVLPSDGATFDASATGGNGQVGNDGMLGGNNGGAGGSVGAGSVRFVSSQGMIDGTNSSAITINLAATGGGGASGGNGLAGAAGGNGGVGGNATGGQLYFAADSAGQIILPQFALNLLTQGGSGGTGGTGSTGQTGDDGVNGGIGVDGGIGGTGGQGGNGGNGANGGSALGGLFSVASLSGASITLGDLDVDLSASAGRSGSGGDGGYGGSGGSGGAGGNGLDNGDDTFVDPGNGGGGGAGGLGGNGGNGGFGADATAGEFTLDANGGTITANDLSARVNAFARTGGQFGYSAPGGEGGSGGEGGYGAQQDFGNPGDPGSAGDYGNYGFYGYDGQAQGGLISITSLADQNGGGTLGTGFAFLDATAALFDGESSTENGPQGAIHILANGAASMLSFNGLQAYAGNSLYDGYGGLIDIGGTDATLNFNNTYLNTSGSIDIHLSGTASIVAGENFEANALANDGTVTIAHDALPGEIETIHADAVRLKARNYIDTTSSRIGAYDVFDAQAFGDVTLGSVAVSGGSISVQPDGPHGAEIRVFAGGNPFSMELGPHVGNLTVNGALDATGSVTLDASNDIFVYSGASIGAANRVNLIADGDVTIVSGASIEASRSPEQGYGAFDPFTQNGMLTIQAGANPRQFSLAPGDISSVFIGGTLEAHNGSISIDGAAIDGTGSTASAQYIRADIFNATDSGSNDFGRLRVGCTEGLICLGGLNSIGTIEIGARGAPLTASITGPTSVNSLNVNASGDIHFGNGSNAFTIQGVSFFHATSTTGNIVLDGPVTLQGDGDFALSAGGAILGAQGRVIAPINLVLTAPGGLSLANLDIGGQFLPTGPIDNFSVSGVFKLGSGDFILSTVNALSLGQIEINNGVAVSLTSTGAGVSVGSIGNAPFGTPGSITVNAAGEVVLTHAETSGNLLVNGASFQSGLNSIITGGDIDINVSGLADLGNSSAGGHADVTADAITFNSLATGAYTSLAATGTINGGTITSATDATLNAPGGITLTGLDAGSSQLFANSGVIDVSNLVGSNITASANSIRLAGAGSFSSNNLSANGGYLILDFGGSITLNSGASAGTTMDLISGGALQFSQLYVGSDLSVNAASVDGDAVYGNGAVAITAPGGITIANLNAGGSSTSFLTATNGDIEVGEIGYGAVGAVGENVSLTSSRTLKGTTLTATAGDLTLRGANLLLDSASATGSIDAQADGTVSFNTLLAGDDLTLSGSTLNGGMIIGAGGVATLSGTDGITLMGLSVRTGTLTASNGAILVTGLGTGSIGASGRSIDLTATGALNAQALTATAGNVTLSGTALSYTSANASGNVTTTATGGRNGFGTLTAGGNAVLTATTIIAGNALTAGGTAMLTAPDGITLSGLNVTGLATLTAANGAIAVSSDRASDTVATARSIAITAPGALTASSLTATAGELTLRGASLVLGNGSATGAIDARSSSGALGFNTLASGGDTTLVSATTATGTTLTAGGTISLTALGSITLGDAAARNAINVSAGTVANLNGALIAPTIAIRSTDIAIGNAARIGTVAGTTQLTFTSTAGTSTIGGNSTGTGYRLSEAELQRAFANNIAIVTAPVGQGDQAIDPNAVPTMTLDTLSLSAAGQQPSGITGNLGTSGTLRFQTGGTMRVTGAIKLTSANNGNRLELSGGPAIQVRPGGSASLVNGSDLAGTLVLTAADIIASDATTLTGLSTAADAKAQSDLLGVNANPTDDTGYFAANAIVANIGHGLFVQNSGATQAAGAQTFDQRRGLTFGSGGLRVVATAGTPVTVAINGRQVSSSATGGFITGAALVPIVQIGSANATTTLVTGSSINGCAIANPGACTFVAPIDRFDPQTVVDPGIVARDVIEEGGVLSEELEAASNAINRPNVLIELPGFTALVGQPLIEDPVTGSGNDDLLADKDGKQCDPSTETCTKD